jgi:hypothetical protein
MKPPGDTAAAEPPETLPAAEENVPLAGDEPTYELIAVRTTTPEGQEIEQEWLKIPTENPKIELYWLMENNGGDE